ncbi:MAG: toxin-antitoxin system, antitoxin component, Xre family protein, partial [Gammaproteobacteria bacterium]|nr:toxin-antitoxin system, antitoxin component, Xre family protein [Gammaproteobacteria bacterium]
MATNKDYMKALLGKLDELPPERVVEVEDFVDFLRHRELDQH